MSRVYHALPRLYHACPDQNIVTLSWPARSPGLEVIKHSKIKRNDWLLAVRKQPMIALYFELETVLKFYNLEA